MKLKIENNEFCLFDIKSPNIKLNGKINNINSVYKINNDNLFEGKNIFIFLDEDENVFNENIELEKACYIRYGEFIIYVYKTAKNNLVFYKHTKISGNTLFEVKKFKYHKNNIEINYKVKKLNPWEITDKIILRERNSQEEIVINITKDHGKIHVSSDVFKEKGIYDIFLIVKIDDELEYIAKTKKYRYLKAIRLKTKHFINDEKTTVISPYTTYKKARVSFKVDMAKTECYELLLKKSATRNVWLIGEQKTKAQDNGYYFFKYLRENHKEVEAYYVIDKSSSDYDRIKDLGNVIDFGSKEHFEIINKVKYLISTHHTDYLFPIQNMDFIKAHKAKKIFLQHGVMGTKYMANFYGNYANNNFSTDMFIVSSKREQDMLVNDFEYDRKNVRITGLARFDNLLNNDTPITNEILIIPTWRDWLANEFNFEGTEYFKRYVSLVNSLRGTYSIKLVLHINMSQYINYFKDLGIEVYVADQVDIQSLLKSSSLMITDYSSVSFDFAFLNKPVIYYQFDQNRFFGNLGSHYDIYEELPGDILRDESQVLTQVKKLKETGYEITEESLSKAQKLLLYKDTNACRRIYVEILKNDYKEHKVWYKTKFFKRGFLIFRKSKFYYPTMKLMYNSLKYLPKKDVVFLESNNAKSFVDSPREIYLKWREIDPEQNFIIAYNQILPIKYKHKTKGIKRLSVSYFYYLARSKYWISNQNFPYYIKNHNTIYLQTWHGIPMKRMLNDLDQIVGRDEGYKNRVQTAVKQWTYLLSTSEYTNRTFQSAFNHNAEVLQVGFPRNDIYFRDNTKLEANLKNKYKIEDGQKVILFAPTFRDNGKKSKGKYIQDLYLDYENLYSKLAGEYIFLIKLHPLSINKEPIPEEYTSLFREVDAKEEINDVMLITDILITDYSSVSFDYLLTSGKTILYAKDLDEYEFNNRGFYFDYKTEAPGIVVTEEEDLINEILNPSIDYDKEAYKAKYINQYKEVSQDVIEIIKGDRKRK